MIIGQRNQSIFGIICHSFSGAQQLKRLALSFRSSTAYLVSSCSNKEHKGDSSTVKVVNELPVIRSLRLRKDLWDHHGANIASFTINGLKLC